MLPPSLMLGLAEWVAVVTSVVSPTLVLAAAVLKVSDSKLVPPLIAVMLRVSLLASLYGSSVLVALTATVPLVSPLAMVMVWPLLRVTVTVSCAAAPRLAV